MNIDIRLEAKLLDSNYGFSDLLKKYDNKLTDESKQEIKELIKEDIYFLVEQCKWTITNANE